MNFIKYNLVLQEMLQQDLGQEPVIFLDLNFEILKAMVEFMYCGETTIAHQFLPSLLEAAITFKVRFQFRFLQPYSTLKNLNNQTNQL